ncbi:MAG: HEAT repeat domain-containing protein [Planctomycetota bacterium]|jgi:hypothetical protein
MSAETGTQDIQLHFCQSCGISIPDTDIETGRAQAAPGGYVCVGCVYQSRDDQLASEGRPTPRAAATGRRAGGGLRTLTLVALAYVVGATSFLLYRELDRKPPTIDLPAMATAEDIGRIAAKVDGVEQQSRRALDQLKANDSLQREDLNKVNQGVNRLQSRFEDHVALVRTQHKDLQDALVELGERTVGLTQSARDILRRLDGFDTGPAPTGGGTTNQPPPKMGDPSKPKTGKPAPKVTVDPETRKLVDKFIKQLLDRSVDKQTRFNAAVQLGDLMDPSAVDALVTALKKDPYDLVRRAAAYSLGMLGKHSARAIPDLIAQMDDKEEYVGYMCERALGDITKVVLGASVSFGFDPTMPAKKRRDVQRKWEAWWEKNRDTVLPGG